MCWLVPSRDDRGLREDEAACNAARAAPFYEEVPLTFPRGQVAGSLAVVSMEARELASEKRNILTQVCDRMTAAVKSCTIHATAQRPSASA